MAPYDSDSSGAEDYDYTETNVLLGYASADANGEEISRLGGRPDWLDPSKPPSAALARCNVCKDLMVLLLQLNAELPDRFPGHERRLYVLTCKRRSCRRKEGSIRAIRGVRVSAEAATTNTTSAGKEENQQPKASATPKPAASGLGEALFGVKPASSGAGTAPRANPFASAAATTTSNPFAPKPAAATTNPFGPSTTPKPTTTTTDTSTPAPGPAEDSLPKTFAETLTLNTTPAQPTTTHGPPPPPEPWPELSSQPTPYPVRWLSDAEYETLDPTPTPAVPTTASMDIDTTEGASGGSGKEDKEVFESTMDSTFQKFADRVGQNPEQCIRYEYGGVPLLYAKGDAVGKLLSAHQSPSSHTGGSGVQVVGGSNKSGMPRCGNCGAGRVFEVQLTPQAIQELEAEEEGMEGMDWGTIIVGVCERDCQERGVKVGEAGYVGEWAGVQWEELTVKR